MLLRSETRIDRSSMSGPRAAIHLARSMALVAIASLVLLGCGGGGPTTGPTSTAATPATITPEPLPTDDPDLTPAPEHRLVITKSAKLDGEYDEVSQGYDVLSGPMVIELLYRLPDGECGVRIRADAGTGKGTHAILAYGATMPYGEMQCATNLPLYGSVDGTLVIDAVEPDLTGSFEMTVDHEGDKLHLAGKFVARKRTEY